MVDFLDADYARTWPPFTRKIPNAFGQPGVLLVDLDRAAEDGDLITQGGLGVELETFMCETFLSPASALELSRRLRKAALTALRAERRLREASPG